MSYYFAIIGTQDNPLFEHEFGTSKQGGDGQPHFPEQTRHLNQFIVHSSLDVVEEVQWGTGQMYLKIIDKFFNNYISTFITASNVKFLLLHQPTAPSTNTTTSTTNPNSSSNHNNHTTNPSASTASIVSGAGPGAIVSAASSRSSTSIAANPTSPATEEAIKNFFTDVYDSWVKASMSPFYERNMPVKSPVFRQRVVAAGKKYL